jgi:hypothetical protein
LERRYNLHGLDLIVETCSLHLCECAEQLLESFSVPGGQRACRVRLCYGTNDERFLEAAGLRRCWQDHLPGGVLASGWANENLRGLYLHEMGLMTLDLGSRTAELVVWPHHESCMNLGLLIPAICDFLALQEQYACHAACFKMTDEQARCVLLFGASGAGKTTTALALHGGGLRLLADDCTILQASEQGRGELRVWGFPRPCKVHRRTFELLDWLRQVVPEPRFVGQESVVPFAQLAPIDVDATAKPALVLFLQERNPHEHRLEPLTTLQAVSELARRTVRAPGGEGVIQAAGAFAAVASLASTTPAMRLSVGPDLASLGPMIRKTVQENS